MVNNQKIRFCCCLIAIKKAVYCISAFGLLTSLIVLLCSLGSINRDLVYEAVNILCFSLLAIGQFTRKTWMLKIAMGLYAGSCLYSLMFFVPSPVAHYVAMNVRLSRSVSISAPQIRYILLRVLAYYGPLVAFLEFSNLYILSVILKSIKQINAEQNAAFRPQSQLDNADGGFGDSVSYKSGGDAAQFPMVVDGAPPLYPVAV